MADPALYGLALALGIGLLLGVERGWRMRDEEAGSRVAGIRTFALLGLLGGIAGIGMASAAWPLSPVLVGGAIAALLLGYGGDMRRDHNVSATSTLAAILTLALGMMATTGAMAIAAVVECAAVILLASREPLHRAIGHIGDQDMRALLRMVLVIFVILPLLPDQGYGPFGALNPRRLWLVIVVTGSISFVGYGLARWLGQRRGALVTALVGAIVSSTAVTLDSARRIRAGASGPADAAAVAIASAMMFARALLLVALLAPFAFAPVATLIAPAAALALLGAAGLYYRSRRGPEEIAVPGSRPPGLGLAALFAFTVAAISLVSAFVQARFGGDSGAVVIALGGTADIDAAIAAVGVLPQGAMPPRSVALAIAAPILLNTLFKLAILLVVARSRRALWGAGSLAAASIALAASIAASLI